jgi:Saxitoxin biosynthesis operon protein SxtJ
MSLFRLQLHPAPRELRMFAGIWFPAIAAVVGLFLWHATGETGPSRVLWSVATGWGVLGLFVPAVMKPAWVALMVGSWPIGFVVSHLVLAVVYYLVITPTGLACRFFRRDPLTRRFDPGAETCWTVREQVPDASRYFRQF